VNDLTYAPLLADWEGPSLYDITDDWLSARSSPRQHERLCEHERSALANATHVVACSAELARRKDPSGDLSIHLVPNAVDSDHFRKPWKRPTDLPSGPCATYVGTLHSSRLDLALLDTLASSLPDVTIALIGPDSLTESERKVLDRRPNIVRMGPRPYGDIPAYLTHSDVIIIPHVISDFTESLDPIKAYECLIAGRPTVATPVAGFRELAAIFAVADRTAFPDAVIKALSSTDPPQRVGDIPSWTSRAASFESILGWSEKPEERGAEGTDVDADAHKTRLTSSLAKQRTKQALRRTLGEVHVGKRFKWRQLDPIFESLRLNPDAILDAGSGDAAFVYYLADRYPGAQVLAADLDSELISACSAARPPRFANRVSFICSDFAGLPDARFDLITALDVLEHIVDDAGAVADLARSMRPGGTLLVHVPTDRWTTFGGTVHLVADEDAWKINEGHVRQGYTMESLHGLLRAAGLSVDRMDPLIGRWGALAFSTYDRLEHPAPARVLSLPVTDAAAWLERRRPPTTGNAIVAVATKPASESSAENPLVQL
jgi:SAM-dependent methyltransferase